MTKKVILPKPHLPDPVRVELPNFHSMKSRMEAALWAELCRWFVEPTVKPKYGDNTDHGPYAYWRQCTPSWRAEHNVLMNVGGLQYELDICIICLHEDSLYDPAVVIDIEIDGQRIHYTKEHIARDRSRDRHLTRGGINVFRFLAAEVFADPEACAQEIVFGCYDLVDRYQDGHPNVKLVIPSKESLEPS